MSRVGSGSIQSLSGSTTRQNSLGYRTSVKFKSKRIQRTLNSIKFEYNPLLTEQKNYGRSYIPCTWDCNHLNTIKTFFIRHSSINLFVLHSVTHSLTFCLLKILKITFIELTCKKYILDYTEFILVFLLFLQPHYRLIREKNVLFLTIDS